jgi:hypothetical protein
MPAKTPLGRELLYIRFFLKMATGLKVIAKKDEKNMNQALK